VIITYTDKQFTLNVTDEQGDTILEMSAADVQFKMDLAHGRPPRRITLSCAACAAFRAGPNERCVMRILT